MSAGFLAFGGAATAWTDTSPRGWLAVLIISSFVVGSLLALLLIPSVAAATWLVYYWAEKPLRHRKGWSAMHHLFRGFGTVDAPGPLGLFLSVDGPERGASEIRCLIKGPSDLETLAPSKDHLFHEPSQQEHLGQWQFPDEYKGVPHPTPAGVYRVTWTGVAEGKHRVLATDYFVVFPSGVYRVKRHFIDWGKN